jgi:hypothetical protein
VDATLICYSGRTSRGRITNTVGANSPGTVNVFPDARVEVGELPAGRIALSAKRSRICYALAYYVIYD